jgi:hypothetical protein
MGHREFTALTEQPSDELTTCSTNSFVGYLGIPDGGSLSFFSM